MRKWLATAVIGVMCSFVLIAWAAKKGGAKCEADSECETNKCSSGTCDPCPDRNNCPPPGTCSEDDNAKYARNVHDVCDQERSCLRVTDFNDQEARFDALNDRLKINNSCINARSEVMDRCYRGGDDNHQRVRRDVTDDRDKCQSLIDTKKGKSLLYFCSQSDYESYDRNIDYNCKASDYTCTESTNDEPVDCRKLDDRLSAGNKCLAARSDMVSHCFDNRWNWVRQVRKEEAEIAVKKCDEVLRYKKDKSLCK